MGEAGRASTDWKWFLTYVDNVKAVTAADLQRVAAAYLVPDHATVGWFVPAANAGKPAAVVAAPAPAPAAVAQAAAGSVAGSAAPAARPAAAAAPARRPFAERTMRKVLANGLIIDVVENHAVPTVAVAALPWRAR
ncbi:MAG: hypothetical protein IPM02_12360 [Betaproteobacteria bacterium]|nr:hypothetical protein [Betaproteobacteria bacterium]